MAKSLPNVGSLLAGRYRIQSKLGEGGYGVVYRARQDAMGRDVAIKVLKPEAAEKKVEVERFRREVFHASGLRHPNTITLHDFGEAQGLFYIVMEYLAGTNLREALMTHGAFDHDSALDVMVQVLRSLREAHERGVVHRDLKPENIFLCKVADGEQFVKVLDFGLSKYAPSGGEVESRLTKDGVIFGTPQYMSPEQAYGQPISPATDVYATGLLLYEMLTANCAFTGRSSMEILIKQVSQPVPALPDQLRGTLLSEYMSRATVKDVDKRFENAGVALKWLERRVHANMIDTNLKLPSVDSGVQQVPPEMDVPSVKDLDVRLAQLPLFGRNEELSKIMEWSSKSKMTGGIASIVGDVGLGKSRLVEEWANQLMLDGVVVLRGKFHENGSPLEGLRDALRPLYEEEAHHQTIPAVLTLDRIKELQAIVEPQHQLDDPPTEELDRERGQHWRFVAIEEALMNIATARPVALILEDIHFADSFSLGLLMHWQEELATRTVPMTLVYSTRIHEIESAEQLNELSRMGQKYSSVSFAFHQKLEPLAKQDSAALVNYLLPCTDETADYILERASGNPLFITELMRFFAEADLFALDKEQGCWFLPRLHEQAVPPNLRQLVLRRLRLLVDKHELGEVLAGIFTRALLLGHRFKIRDLNELLTIENRPDLQSRLDDAIDVLLKAYFLAPVVVDGQPGLEFSYDIVRDALLDSPPIELEEVVKLHLLIADQKVGAYNEHSTAADAAEIAFHFGNTDRRRDQFDWLVRAARAAESAQDFRAALIHFRDAENSLDKEIDPHGERLLDIRLALGRCYRFLGEFGPAEFALGSAHEEARRVGDIVGEAQSGELLADIQMLLAQYDEAEKMYRHVEVLYGKFPDPIGQIRCAIGLAEIARYRGEYLKADAQFQDALKRANEEGDANVALRSMFGLGQCAYGAGRLKEAHEIFQRARKTAEAIGDVRRVSDADIEISIASVRTHGVSTAEALARQALETKRSIGDTLGVAYAHLAIGIALRRSARLGEAEFHCRRALMLAERLNHPYAIAKTILLLSEIAWVRGDLDEALQHGRESERLHQELGDWHGIALAKSFIALYEVERGNIEIARKLTTESLEIGERVGLGLYHAQCVLLHAMVHEREDNLEEALAYYGEALQRAEATGNRETASMAASGLTAVHVAIGDFEALKEDVPIARSQAEHLGNNIAMSFAIAAEALLSKLDGDLVTLRASLEMLRALNDAQPGLVIPRRIFEVGLRALKHQSPERGARTASALADLLQAIGADDLAIELLAKTRGSGS